MPAPAPAVSVVVRKKLRAVGQRLRDRRKQLGLSAAATAEAAGMSRVTLYRVEKGEPSVAMGSYASVIAALGFELSVGSSSSRRVAKPPKKIVIADYPQLARLAWQLDRTQELSPADALELYERNWRHVNRAAMDAREIDLLEALLAAFGSERLLV